MTNKTKYSVEQKREVLYDLLMHFKTVNNNTNMVLQSNGEGSYCSPFEEIPVRDIKEYALAEEGWGEF